MKASCLGLCLKFVNYVKKKLSNTEALSGHELLCMYPSFVMINLYCAKTAYCCQAHKKTTDYVKITPHSLHFRG